MWVAQGPRRIVCLTEETTEFLYALGEEERIVGISAYTLRPPEAKRTRPVVSAFVGGSVERILALKPDLVIGFSDVQADWARTLIHAGLQVLIFNQRSLQEIFEALLVVGRIVAAEERSRVLLGTYAAHLESIARRRAGAAWRPKVYFEEWDEPMATCVQWVSELIEIAGGHALFADRSRCPAFKDRHVSPEEVAVAAPDVILASWCGKPFDEHALRDRLSATIPALARGHVHEVDAAIILQPGPAALTDGVSTIAALLDQASLERPSPS